MTCGSRLLSNWYAGASSTTRHTAAGGAGILGQHETITHYRSSAAGHFARVCGRSRRQEHQTNAGKLVRCVRPSHGLRRALRPSLPDRGLPQPAAWHATPVAQSAHPKDDHGTGRGSRAMGARPVAGCDTRGGIRARLPLVRSRGSRGSAGAASLIYTVIGVPRTYVRRYTHKTLM